MLFLMFQLGRDRYVLDTAEVEAVLPLLAVKLLPAAPAGVAGAISYRGTPVPLIDLSLLALGRPAAPVLSTRIILLRYPAEQGERRLLGLMAERAVETITRDPADFVASGVEAGMPPYLGPVAADEDGLIQWVRPEALLPPEIRDILFRQLAAGT
ncbi:Chemotaxis signal transduction protein [Hyphomicrobiales bacterium]|nr:Chemotaxis signal transduction protein [Hyphomicrobiales bacterium]CAH1697501.1 Chemotaxis signal transduction protein [Hyphomicrobiales bacterium]CAI0345689.1 chemotaxis-related protein WspB [Hyphomicrobiales bacterium]